MARITASTLQLFADVIHLVPPRFVDGAFTSAGFPRPPERRIVYGRESLVTFRSYVTKLRLGDLETQQRLVKACASLLHGMTISGQASRTPALVAALDDDGFTLRGDRLVSKDGTALAVRATTPRPPKAAIAPEHTRVVRSALRAATAAGVRASLECTAGMGVDGRGRVVDIEGEAWVYTANDRSDVASALRRVGSVRIRDGVLCISLETHAAGSTLSARRAGAMAAAETLTRLLGRPFRCRLRVSA